MAMGVLICQKNSDVRLNFRFGGDAYLSSGALPIAIGARLAASFFDRCEDIDNCLGAWSGAEISFAVHANADGARLEIALSNHEHRMNLLLLGALDLSID